MENKKQNSLLAKCAYGLCDIYGGGAFVIIGTFFTVFLTKALGMAPALAGTIPLIGKVWDAVTDPLMGNITDRTSSKYGAKRFYMLIGSVISGITFILMWVSLKGMSQTAQYIFYVLMYMLFSTGFTIVMVPYNGLLPDMVESYEARGGFTGIRMIFSTVGAILAGLIPTIMVKDNTDPTHYLTVALIFGVLFAVVIFLSFLGTWEKQKPVHKVGFKESFTQSFTVYRSRSFRIFLGIFLFGQGSADFITGMAVYYVDDVLNAYRDGNFTMMMGVLLVAQLIGMFVFNPVVSKRSKTLPVLIGFPIRILATLALLFVSYEGAPFVVVLVLSFLIGIGTAASSVSIYAIMADMADVDELITSVNRPSVCSAMATFMRKIASGLCSSIIGVLLAIVGYNETIANAGERQAAATQQGIAVMYVAVPVILMIGTLVMVFLFPMGRKEFNVIKKEIARRKGECAEPATEEEKKICEKVTGFAFDRLWNPDNAYHFNR